jgi:hypothetical protein
MIPMKSTGTTQGEHVFFGTDVKGAEKVRPDATVGGLSSIGKPFMVFIIEKGGYCWHAYRKSVLVIDGNNNSEPNLERVEDEKYWKR